MVIAYCDRFLRLRKLALCDYNHYRENYEEHLLIAYCDRFLRLRMLLLCDYNHHHENYGEHLLLYTLSEYTCDEHSSDQKTALRYCVLPDALECLLGTDFHPLKYHDIR